MIAKPGSKRVRQSMVETAAARLILASASAARSDMLANAGLTFDVEPAQIDERAIQDVFSAGNDEVEPADIAEILAEAKARDVSQRNPGALVIGSDQVLNLGTKLVTKAADLAAVRVTLRQLRGNVHNLHAAVALARDGEIVWSTVETASLKMRNFSDAFLDAYITAEGERLCASVGAFKLEGLGMQLFDQIDGDFFTILGMPLLPLLAALRAQGAIAS
jgi:septum formation protein